MAEKEFVFFNKALKEREIYHIGLNKGQYVPLSSRSLSNEEVQEEFIWGKENRNIKKGILPAIKTTRVDLNADAIRKIKHGKSSDTITLVELQGITGLDVKNKRINADDIILAVADILPFTTILCLNLGELDISKTALKYLLSMVQHDDCILGALFIETDYKKKEFQIALAVNRKKIRFLYRVSENIRYSYLRNYTSAWWNLRNNTQSEWYRRYEKLENIRASKSGMSFENGIYYPIEEEEEEEEHDDDHQRKKKRK